MFSRDDAFGTYGPGSMTWFKSPDGSQDWVAFHVKTTTANDFSGDDRRLEVKQVTWNGSTPVLGTPLQLNASYSLPTADPGTVDSAPSASAWSINDVNVNVLRARLG